MLSLVQNMDDTILLFIKNSLHGVFLDKIMVFVTTLGNNGLIWILIAMWLILVRKQKRSGMMLLITLAASTLIGDVLLKFVVQRPRPCANVEAIRLLIDKPLSYSFPSGHAMSSFACAGILAAYYRKWAPWFLLLAALIAFSRMYLQVHYPSDVLAGAVFGVLVSWIVLKLSDRYFHNTEE